MTLLEKKNGVKYPNLVVKLPAEIIPSTFARIKGSELIPERTAETF